MNINEGGEQLVRACNSLYKIKRPHALCLLLTFSLSGIWCNICLDEIESDKKFKWLDRIFSFLKRINFKFYCLFFVHENIFQDPNYQTVPEATLWRQLEKQQSVIEHEHDLFIKINFLSMSFYFSLFFSLFVSLMCPRVCLLCIPDSLCTFSTTASSNSASTLQTKSFNNTSTITCLFLNKKSTNARVSLGPS